MDQRQKNARKMYTNVLQFFGHAGARLLGIKKIKELVDQATADVAAVDAEAKRQPADTTGVTRTRTEVKKGRRKSRGPARPRGGPQGQRPAANCPAQAGERLPLRGRCRLSRLLPASGGRRGDPR